MNALKARKLRNELERRYIVCSINAENKRIGARCVGGAFILNALPFYKRVLIKLGIMDDQNTHFPASEEIDHYLRKANYALDMVDDRDYAYCIVNANDAHNFKQAWDALETALAYPFSPLLKG